MSTYAMKMYVHKVAKKHYQSSSDMRIMRPEM